MDTDQMVSHDPGCSAKNSLKTINFYCAAPDADSVQIVGDFNNWHPHAMRRTLDGWWFARMTLCHGHHCYQFVVDGKPQLDPQATGVVFDEQNGQTSLIAVS